MVVGYSIETATQAACAIVEIDQRPADGAAMGVTVDAGVMITSSILLRRAFWIFAYIATSASPIRITIINLTPVRGARDKSAPLFCSVEGSTPHRPLPATSTQDSQSIESAAIASITC
jgi:hypothetical protein